MKGRKEKLAPVPARNSPRIAAKKDLKHPSPSNTSDVPIKVTVRRIKKEKLETPETAAPAPVVAEETPTPAPVLAEAKAEQLHEDASSSEVALDEDWSGHWETVLPCLQSIPVEASVPVVFSSKGLSFCPRLVNNLHSCFANAGLQILLSCLSVLDILSSQYAFFLCQGLDQSDLVPFVQFLHTMLNAASNQTLSFEQTVGVSLFFFPLFFSFSSSFLMTFAGFHLMSIACLMGTF